MLFKRHDVVCVCWNNKNVNRLSRYRTAVGRKTQTIISVITVKRFIPTQYTCNWILSSSLCSIQTVNKSFILEGNVYISQLLSFLIILYVFTPIIIVLNILFFQSPGDLSSYSNEYE